ncbi:MAG: ParA family protein [Endomicrobium sp.]|jgi:chromosome partitioning protein|nr:ParA family protein [Endomicrobium sp.]
MNQIILLTHQKGGVGKSTIAYNLAQTFKKNSKVAIIDFDFQGSLLQVSGISDFDIFSYNGKLDKIKELPYDFTFIDTPPYIMDRLEELCNISDIILIPTKAGILDLFAIEKTIKVVRDSGNMDKAFVVFNMVKPNTNLTEDIQDKVKEFGIRQANTKLNDFVAFSRSVLGQLENPKAQQQIDELSSEVLDFLISQKSKIRNLENS